MANNTFSVEAAAAFLGSACEPLTTWTNDASAAAYVAQVGFVLPSVPPGFGLVAVAASGLKDALGALITAELDETDDTTAVAEVIAGVAAVIAAIEALPSSLTAAPSQGGLPPTYLADSGMSRPHREAHRRQAADRSVDPGVARHSVPARGRGNHRQGRRLRRRRRRHDDRNREAGPPVAVVQRSTAAPERRVRMGDAHHKLGSALRRDSGNRSGHAFRRCGDDAARGVAGRVVSGRRSHHHRHRSDVGDSTHRVQLSSADGGDHAGAADDAPRSAGDRGVRDRLTGCVDHTSPWSRYRDAVDGRRAGRGSRDPADPRSATRRSSPG